MKPAVPPPSSYRPGGHIDVQDDTVHDPYFQRHKPAEPGKSVV